MSKWLGAAAGFAAGLSVAGAPEAHAAAFNAHRDHVLGTSFDLAAAADRESGAVATAAALDEIARLDRVLSGWRDDSELAALNRASVFDASPELFDLVAYGEALRGRTGNAFSPRLGRLNAIWRATAAPAYAEHARLAAAIAQAPVALDASRRRITRPDVVQFDLDAFAKGYIIDRAMIAARAAAPSAKGFLINIGGDLAGWGVDPNGRAWRASVAAPGASDNARPATTVVLDNAALAMSGGGARDIVFADGARVSHVTMVDGAAASASRGAAVVAPSAMIADALATALVAMPADAARAYADTYPRTGARLFGVRGEAANVFWRSVEANACQAAAAWPSGFSLDITFDLPRLDVGNYERPYVSIWISDANRQLVRTLMVLGDKARWREENYVWWRRYERLDLDTVQNMARPSRAPGRYTVTWDGRDNAGRSAPQGAYTLNIEVAREHGGHSFQAIPLNLAAAPVDAGVAADGELGAVSAHYGP